MSSKSASLYCGLGKTRINLSGPSLAFIIDRGVVGRNTLNRRLENGKKLEGKPVVTSNLALAWHTLQLSGIDTRDSTFAKQHGKLFRSAMMREAK